MSPVVATPTRSEELRDLLDRVRSLDGRNDRDFQEILGDSQKVLELSDQEVADSLLVSRPTVSRWVRGKNLPHRAMRKPILEWVQEQLIGRLRRLQHNQKRSHSEGT